MKKVKKTTQQIKSFKRLIIVLSIAIPTVVALLFSVKIEGIDLSFLPHIYAYINGINSIVLISALIAIKKKNITLHQNLIKTALTLSSVFLVLYISYHMTSDSAIYGGDFKIAYYTILISHITLSAGIVPFVLISYFQAWRGNYKKHKKWVRFAFPIWLYVTISGVVVYLMISPFY